MSDTTALAAATLGLGREHDALSAAQAELCRLEIKRRQQALWVSETLAAHEEACAAERSTARRIEALEQRIDRMKGGHRVA